MIADWTGKAITGFTCTVDDICEVIRQTCDLAMPPVPPRGTARVTSPDGFVTQHDDWTSWHVSRPFSDEVAGDMAGNRRPGSAGRADGRYTAGALPLPSRSSAHSTKRRSAGAKSSAAASRNPNQPTPSCSAGRQALPAATWQRRKWRRTVFSG
ncbi:MAG: hypothetical protein BWZ02_02564 [Lentisphaerae bacterium ADurb.BinA184]|nr:MAG: hypothetical protein BWZ02_02564 [Lentisphaerae bacterium ADurb.BinA184]